MGVALVGLAIRVAYVLIARADISFGGDAYFYHAGANLLADGEGFISPFEYELGRSTPAAEHPPLYLIYLAVPSALGLTSTLTHLLWSCALGSTTIVLVGYLGRAVAGARVGLLAAAIAAVYPNMWIPDGALQAETLAMTMTALVLLLAYRYLQQPGWGWLAAVGAASGGAALARSELALLVPLLIVPMVLLTRTVEIRQRLRWLGVSVLAAAVVVAPWIGYNLARFERPVLLSTQFEILLASANCDDVYYGSNVGYFTVVCALDVKIREELGPELDQSEQASAYRRAALDYINDHKPRLPAVVAARVGRVLGVFRPTQQLRIERVLDGREAWAARAGLISFYAVALLAITGAIVLRRRCRAPIYPLLAVPALVLITVAVTYGNLRFRAPAEVSLAVLAAVAIRTGYLEVGRRLPALRRAPPER